LDIIKNNADNADIVLLDLAMPEFSGLDVFAFLRNEGLLEKRMWQSSRHLTWQKQKSSRCSQMAQELS
jgi:CheY-like chemotaxis protein